MGYFFTALRDKEGYGPKRLQRVWKAVASISESIAAGYINAKDLAKVLEEEAGFILK